MGRPGTEPRFVGAVAPGAATTDRHHYLQPGRSRPPLASRRHDRGAIRTRPGRRRRAPGTSDECAERLGRGGSGYDTEMVAPPPPRTQTRLRRNRAGVGGLSAGRADAVDLYALATTIAPGALAGRTGRAGARRGQCGGRRARRGARAADAADAGCRARPFAW